MEKLVLNIPTLYADHHTTAVKNLLEGIEGIQETFVSSAFKQVSIGFDPKKISPEEIERTLAAAGYSQEDEESAFAASIADKVTRHTAAYAGVGDSLSFAEAVSPYEGRPLWPCPGLDYQPGQEV
jgi:copper chaperone CopZ